MQELKDKDLYYDRPASELIFMRKQEHHSLHSTGKHHSAETCKKMSEAHKGKNHSYETRQKMSEAHKGKHHSAETCKKMSEARKGKHWYNNGDTSILAKTCPEGFVPGRIK